MFGLAGAAAAIETAAAFAANTINQHVIRFIVLILRI
jgi:hypothetical protein